MEGMSRLSNKLMLGLQHETFFELVHVSVLPLLDSRLDMVNRLQGPLFLVDGHERFGKLQFEKRNHFANLMK